MLFRLFIIIFALFSSSVAALEPDSNNVAWGAVGHDDHTEWGVAYPYNYVSIEQQLSLLQSSGMKSFRAGCTDVTCEMIAKAAFRKNILFLRSIEMRPDEHVDEQGNFQLGYKHGFAEGKKYKGLIHYYEASNELDVWTGVSGDGSTRDQYAPAKYLKARGFLRGLITGLHAADPSIKVAVDDTGWCHYGFLRALWEDGLRWDITAVHWYENMKNIEKAGCNNANIAQIHSEFGKPVWITEFNSDIAATAGNREAAAKWITDFMNQINAIAPKYNIQAAMAYELFDEPNMKGMEANFGIADSIGRPKPALSAMKKVLAGKE